MPALCFCAKTLAGLDGLVPPPLPSIRIPTPVWSPLGALAKLLGEIGGAPLSADVDLPIPQPTLAKLSLLGSVVGDLGALGFPTLEADATLAIRPLFDSLNAHLPALPGGVPPLSPTLSEVGLLAGVVDGVKTKWGIDLATPEGPALLQAKLDAMNAAKGVAGAATIPGDGKLEGRLEGNVDLGASSFAPSVAIDASAAAPSAIDVRDAGLVELTRRCGLSLSAADPLAALRALADGVAGLDVPPLAIAPASVAQIVAMFASMAGIQAGLGVNLLAPGSLTALSAALKTIDMSALGGLRVDGAPGIGGSLAATASVASGMSEGLGARAGVSITGTAPGIPSLAAPQLGRGALPDPNAGGLAAALDDALAPLEIGALTSIAQSLALARSMAALGLPLATAACDACGFL